MSFEDSVRKGEPLVAERVRQESIDKDFQHPLQDQIAEALQPVLVKVRRELSEAIREQTDGERDRRGIEPGLEVERVPVARPPGSDPTSRPVSGSPIRPQSDQRAQEASSGDLRPALMAVLHALAERAEHGLGSWIDRALEQAISGAVREAVRQYARHGLHSLIDEAFAAAPDSIATQELRQQTTAALEDVLDDMTESLLSGPIRADLTTHGEQIIGAVMRRDFEAAHEHLEQALRESLHDALELLRPHWSQILRLVLPVVVKAAGSAMGSKVKEGAQELASGDNASKEETSEETPKPVTARNDDLRDLFTETTATLRRQVGAEVESVNQRLTEGLSTAAKDSMRNQQLGRPPSVRKSNRPANVGHGPSRRGPPGRHPSVR